MGFLYLLTRWRQRRTSWVWSRMNNRVINVSYLFGAAAAVHRDRAAQRAATRCAAAATCATWCRGRVTAAGTNSFISAAVDHRSNHTPSAVSPSLLRDEPRMSIRPAQRRSWPAPPSSSNATAARALPPLQRAPPLPCTHNTRPSASGSMERRASSITPPPPPPPPPTHRLRAVAAHSSPVEDRRALARAAATRPAPVD